MAPSVAAASMPRMPPELGTVTLLTFLMMFPLHATVRCSGRARSAPLASAAASATAMGSVHPRAQMSSSLSIATWFA